MSTNSLSYTYQVGGPNPPDQTVTLTSTTPSLAYTVAAASSGNWLSVNVTSALTGSPITVSVNPAGLPAGTYAGTLSFNALGAANNPQTVNVTLTVTNNPTLSASPNPIVFNYEIGQSVPGPQTVSVTASGAPLTFTLTSTGVANGINWLLTGSPSSNTTPASFTVGVNPVGLPTNVYTGTIQLAPPGSTPLNIPVTLNVSNVALLNLPTSISFTSVVATQPGHVRSFAERDRDQYGRTGHVLGYFLHQHSGRLELAGCGSRKRTGFQYESQQLYRRGQPVRPAARGIQGESFGPLHQRQSGCHHPGHLYCNLG